MRRILLIISLLLFTSLSAQMKIGVITDTHYLSEQLMDGGNAVDNYMLQTGRMIKYGTSILDSVFEYYSKVKIDVLLVCGDITKDGERESHIDFAKRLADLRAIGTKVFVVPGNHDINMPNSSSFIQNDTYKADNVDSQEFEDIYADCGYNSAIMRDKLSLSYVATLDHKTWLLAIDAARYKEYTSHSFSSGRISGETEDWINKVLDKAKAENVTVLGMMHWGLVEHIPYQSILLKDYLVSDWDRLSDLWAKNGMKVIFTGHCHANDITKHTTKSGNVIYDIETGALCSYPFTYRVIDYYPNKMKIRTRNITSVGNNTNLADESKQILGRLVRKMAKNKIRVISESYSPETLELLANFMAQTFLLHLRGDEVITPELEHIAKKIEQMTDGEIGDIANLEIELPPRDNNVTINF